MLCTRFYAQGCTFNAQGSRLIIVIVHVRAVRISMQEQWRRSRKRKEDETQFPEKLMVFWVSTPNLNANVLFASFFRISPHVWPNSGFWCYVLGCFERITLSTKSLWKLNQLRLFQTMIPYNELSFLLLNISELKTHALN